MQRMRWVAFAPIFPTVEGRFLCGKNQKKHHKILDKTKPK